MNKNILIFVLALTMSAFGAKAQVTIGDLKDPESFSILELISNGNRGLRLPQLSATEKANAFGIENDVLKNAGKVAEGLTIFNTTTRCVETWNGTAWIQSCPPGGPAVPLQPAFPATSNCTITQQSGTVYTAMEDPNAAAYEFFVNNVSQGQQESNVLTLESPVNLSAVKVQYLYPQEFLKPKMLLIPGNDGCHSCGGTTNIDCEVTSAVPVTGEKWYNCIIFCNKLSIMEGKIPCYYILDGNGGILYSAQDLANIDKSLVPSGYAGVPRSSAWSDSLVCDFTSSPNAGYRLPTQSEWVYAYRAIARDGIARTGAHNQGGRPAFGACSTGFRVVCSTN